MSGDLLVPAAAELLDGWCGPVVIGCQWFRGPLEQPVMDGVLHTEAYGPLAWDGPEVTCVWLDLSRPECRDRVARCLSERVGLKVGWAGPSWHYIGHGRWVLDGTPTSRPRAFYPDTLSGNFHRPRKVPALATIPEDAAPEWRAARALALCWAEVTR